MSDFEAPSNRVVTVEPGDVLVIGHAPNLTTQQADQLKQALGLKAVIAVPGIVDLATIKATDQTVQVVVSVLPDAAEIQRAVRKHLRGR